MNNNIDTRSPFFPNSRTGQKQTEQAAAAKRARSLAESRNTYDRAEEIRAKTSNDAKVSIPDTIKDFSRIKKAADTAPEMDNSAKIADLKARIQAGTYEVDYDALADKMLQTEY